MSTNYQYLHIKISDETQIFALLYDVKLPYTHRFDQLTELDSMIVEMNLLDCPSVFCLLRINLEEKIDALHIEYYCLDILIDIKQNSVVCISDKIKISDKHILSSIKYDEAPSIWTKNVEF